jgi:hypothetical protein
MPQDQTKSGVPQLTFKQQMGILVPFAWDKVKEQIACVWFVLAYMIVFQLLVLGIDLAYALMIAVGIGITILGLAFFMEGLRLGLMPLGEVLGSTLPRKKIMGIPCLPTSLLFGFILGAFATFAEPAIAVLQQAGSSVRPDQAPLLYTLLNDYAPTLVNSVGLGVGCAVMLGVLRFYRGWSLKPFIVVGVLTLSAITIYFQNNPILKPVLGLAWDCGAVTTGPVTVPLVLALGIGVCRIVSSGGSSNTGFGVVTLASLFPILAVLTLSVILFSKNDYFGTEKFSDDGFQKGNSVVMNYIKDKRETANPPLLPENDLFTEKEYQTFDGSKETLPASFPGLMHELMKDMRDGKDVNQTKLTTLINDLNKLQPTTISAPNEEFSAAEIAKFVKDGSLPANHAIRFTKPVEGSVESSSEEILLNGAQLKIVKLGDSSPVPPAGAWKVDNTDMVTGKDVSISEDLKIKFTNGLKFFPDEKKDEKPRGALEGAIWAIIPLCSILLGFLMIGLRQNPKHLDELLIGVVCALIGMTLFGLGIAIGLTPLGDQLGSNIVSAFKAMVPWEFQRGIKAPLIDGEAGKFIAVIFAFILGYGATLAEPALNALGATVEKITVGAFKKSLLMQAVALGVAMGIGTGVAKIAFNLELTWLLVPPYLLLIPITLISSEDFVNFGWDSAGVTTGPITVPLVLAMGLGIGAKTGAVDGFGVLALASVGPILTVLTVGLLVGNKKTQQIEDQEETLEPQAKAA